MAWYRVGTITVTNGSTTVTGSGTAWIANAGIGEALYAPDGRLYEIASISSDTTMTLASAYLGSSQSGQSYVIVPSQSYIRDLAAQAADLVNNYSTIYNTVGQGKFPDGTLAAPSIRFSDDLDTGFYRSASNEVTFVAGGVAQFKYNSSGLTLLNGSQSFTTIDATTLEVTNIKAKDGTAAGSIADSTGVVTFGSTILTTTDINGGTIDGTAIGGATPAAGAFTTLTTSSNVTLSGGTANAVAYLNASKVLTTGSALTFDGTNFATTGAINLSTLSLKNNAPFYTGANIDAGANALGIGGGLVGFFTGGSERMRLTSTGLGIGTSSPAYKLDVNGIANFANDTIHRVGGQPLFAQSSDASLTYFYSGLSATVWRNQTDTAELMRLDASGNLGIGTSSPGAKLNVSATASTIGQVRIDGTGVGALFAGMTAGSIGFLHSNTGTLAFGTSSSDNNLVERMRLDASGNLGLGVTPSAWTPTYRKAIQVNTYSALSGDSYYGLTDLSNNAYESATGTWKYISSGPASYYRQDNNGRHQWFTAPSGTAGNPITFTQAMTLDASGNLGVGTTSPGSLRLKVVGAGGNLAGNAYYVGLIGDGSASNKGVGIGYDSSGQVGIIYSETNSSPSNLAFWTYSGSGWGERMRIDSSGNVGIGISSPSYKLQVTNSTATDIEAAVTNSAGVSRYGTRGSGNAFVGAFTAGKSLEFWSAGVNTATLDSNGNVQTTIGKWIGTSSGASYVPDDGVFGGTINNGGGFKITTGGAERMRIDSSGNVGIGTASPSSYASKLVVNGNISLALGGIQYFWDATDSTGTYIKNANNSSLVFGKFGGAEYARFDSSGNVLVGTTSNVSPTAKMVINSGSAAKPIACVQTTTAFAGQVEFYNPNGSVGLISTSGTSTAYSTSSDYRLKENIQPMQNALGVVAQLNPVTYTWKADGSDGQGFIAHELQAVVPDAVTGTKDAVDADGKPVYQGVDTSFLVATLTAAIKEQQQMINELRNEIAALKGALP